MCTHNGGRADRHSTSLHRLKERDFASQMFHVSHGLGTSNTSALYNVCTAAIGKVTLVRCQNANGDGVSGAEIL